MRVQLKFLFLLASFATLGAELRGSAQAPPQGAEGMPQARITGRVMLSDTRGPARNAAILLTSLDACAHLRTGECASDSRGLPGPGAEHKPHWQLRLERSQRRCLLVGRNLQNL